MIDQDYNYLKKKMYEITKLDLNCYKSEQMRRRLVAYVDRHECATAAAYCKKLESNYAEQRALLDYLAINVSEFFRDQAQFENLRAIILSSSTFNRRLKIWSAACSCGQEPYSLVILLEETLPGSLHHILATDIDESALEKAKAGGPYSTYDIRNIKKHLLDKYFFENEAGYWIQDRIKNKVTFLRQNLLEDPFDHNYDLIVCRNVIIYFSEGIRDNLYGKFHGSLKDGGILFLGGSEIILQPSRQGFQMLYPALYRKMSPVPVS